MEQHPHDETVRRTGSGGDIDDLIFCADPVWTVSDR